MITENGDWKDSANVQLSGKDSIALATFAPPNLGLGHFAEQRSLPSK